MTGTVFPHLILNICLSFQIQNLFRTLSSWGSINYKTSDLRFSSNEVASHVKQLPFRPLLLLNRWGWCSCLHTPVLVLDILFLPVFGRTNATIWTEIRQTHSTMTGTFCAHAYIRITKFINHRYLWRMSAISMPKPQSYAWHICKTKQEETRTGRHCRTRTSAPSCIRIFGLLSEFFVTIFISEPVIDLMKCFICL